MGTTGYVSIEGWTVLDALYMTITTITTVGFGEIKPLSPFGRVFTIIIILFGVGLAAYLVGLLTSSMFEGTLQHFLGRRKLENQIKKLSGHYILCGYGRIGRMVAKDITDHKLPLVVLENDPHIIDQLEHDGMLYVKGDAADEDNLIAAGIKRAAGLIAAVSSDADNLYVVLTARGLNPDLYIITRASAEKSQRKLLGAGADRVFSPYVIGARKMAQSVLRPAVADFIETMVHGGSEMNLAMEEILVTATSKLQNVTLQESNIRRDLDLIIIAIKTLDGEMLFNPSANTIIRVGDTLIAVGLRDNMDRLESLLGADTAKRPMYTPPRSKPVA